MHSKNYASRFVKTSYNLEQREYVLEDIMTRKMNFIMNCSIRQMDRKSIIQEKKGPFCGCWT